MPDIFKFSVTPASRQLAASFDDIGVGEIIDDLILESLAALSDLAQDALQSAVPIRTGELRNEHIQTRLDYDSADVFIDDRSHTSSRFFDKDLGVKNPPSDALGALLNVKPFRRSRASQPEPGFSPVEGSTEGWIQHAIESYESLEDIVLERVGGR